MSSFYSNHQWKNILAFIFLFLSLFLDVADLFFGIIFIIWTIRDLPSRTTFLIDEVNKDENRIMYYILILTWIFLSVYMIINGYVELVNNVLPQFFQY